MESFTNGFGPKAQRKRQRIDASVFEDLGRLGAATTEEATKQKVSSLFTTLSSLFCCRCSNFIGSVCVVVVTRGGVGSSRLDKSVPLVGPVLGRDFGTSPSPFSSWLWLTFFFSALYCIVVVVNGALLGQFLNCCWAAFAHCPKSS